MNKIILILLGVVMMAGACQKAELKRELPDSPKESYGELPK